MTKAELTAKYAKGKQRKEIRRAYLVIRAFVVQHFAADGWWSLEKRIRAGLRLNKFKLHFG